MGSGQVSEQSPPASPRPSLPVAAVAPPQPSAQHRPSSLVFDRSVVGGRYVAAGQTATQLMRRPSKQGTSSPLPNRLQRARSAVALGMPPPQPVSAVSGRGTPVLLHIYDLGTTGAGQVLNTVLRVFGTGAFHCGVEVYGKEWSYRGRAMAGTGVFATRPRCCDCHTYSETLSMGDTPLSPAEVSRLIALLQQEWVGTSYDTLRYNCCHFCDRLCRCLAVGEIPRWITNMAAAGAALVDTGRDLNNTRQVLVKGMSSAFHCDGQQALGSEVIESDVTPSPSWLA